jgi:hypothetical protein
MALPQIGQHQNTSAPSGTKRGRGQPKFIPSTEQKNFVSVMAGMRMSHAEIAGVIINPRTQKPIDDMTLRRAFAAELAVAKAKIKSLVSTRFYEALLRGEQWAINFGLRHFLGYRNDDVKVSIGGGDHPSAEDTGIQVEFIRATKWGHCQGTQDGL